jgi:hypothetical protein
LSGYIVFRLPTIADPRPPAATSLILRMAPWFFEIFHPPPVHMTPRANLPAKSGTGSARN